MVNVRDKKRCGHGGCTKIPSYGAAGSRKKRFCVNHAEAGVVPVNIGQRSHGQDGAGDGSAGDGTAGRASSASEKRGSAPLSIHKGASSGFMRRGRAKRRRASVEATEVHLPPSPTAAARIAAEGARQGAAVGTTHAAATEGGACKPEMVMSCKAEPSDAKVGRHRWKARVGGER